MTRNWRLGVSGTALAMAGATMSAVVAFADPPPREVIVVTGTAIASAAGETLQSATVIDADTIREGAIGSIGDSLDQVPGVSSTYFGPAAGAPVIRGQSSDRVRVLSNGLGAFDAASVSPDHANAVEAFEAERIEILRGPAAIAYGGGASGGVVNVIDGRIPDAVPEGGIEGAGYVGASSVDEGSQIAGRLRAGAGAFAVHAEASFREAGDFEIPGFAESARLRALEEDEHEGEEHDEDEHEEEEVEGLVENSRLEFATASIGGAFVGERGRLGAAIRRQEGDYGLPGHGHGHEEEHAEEASLFGKSGLSGALGEDDEEEEEGDAKIDLEQTRVDLVGELDVALGPFDRLETAAAIVDYEHQEIEGSGEVGTTFTNEGWEARASLRNGAEGEAWSGVIGVQALVSEFGAIGEEAFIAPVDTEDFGVFLAQRRDLGAWGLEGGARFETRQLEQIESGVTRDFDTVSASIGAFARPADGVFAGVTLNRTERAPTNVELFADGPHLATDSFEIGDLDLGVETGLGVDGNLRITRPAWSLDIGVFATDYEDYIVLLPTGEEEDELPVFVFSQSDANFWGGEIAGHREIGTFAGWFLDVDGALEYVRADLEAGDAPRIPPFSATLGAELETDRASLRAEAVYAAEQDRVAAFELPTDSYTLVNLRGVLRPLAGANVELIGEVRNVTDEEARVHASALKDLVPLPGRSYRIGLSASF